MGCAGRTRIPARSVRCGGVREWVSPPPAEISSVSNAGLTADAAKPLDEGVPLPWGISFLRLREGASRESQNHLFAGRSVDHLRVAARLSRLRPGQRHR